MIPLYKQLENNYYNFEEQKIGKYNGKNLYSKTIKVSAPTVVTDGTYPGTAENSISDLNPEDCFVVEAYAITESNGNIYPLPYTNNSDRIIKCFYNKGLRTISVATNSIAYSECTVLVKIYYTKR